MSSQSVKIAPTELHDSIVCVFSQLDFVLNVWWVNYLALLLVSAVLCIVRIVFLRTTNKYCCKHACRYDRTEQNNNATKESSRPHTRNRR